MFYSMVFCFRNALISLSFIRLLLDPRTSHVAQRVKSLWARQFGFPIIANPISQTSLFYTMLLKFLQEVLLSRVHEEMEPEQKQHPAGDVTGDGNKVRCYKEQYFIGT